MGESLTEQCYVKDEGLRIVNFFTWMYSLKLASEQKVTTNYVPAVAVRHRWRTLSGIIGRKGCVDGSVSYWWEIEAQPRGSQ